jgi:hypothetical protein
MSTSPTDLQPKPERGSCIDDKASLHRRFSCKEQEMNVGHGKEIDFEVEYLDLAC